MESEPKIITPAEIFDKWKDGPVRIIYDNGVIDYG